LWITSNEIAVKTKTISQTELSLNERNSDKNIAFEESVAKKDHKILIIYKIY
jgi:hypothetical protein